jgi:hypothetical protein
MLMHSILPSKDSIWQIRQSVAYKRSTLFSEIKAGYGERLKEDQLNKLMALENRQQ